MTKFLIIYLWNLVTNFEKNRTFVNMKRCKEPGCKSGKKFWENWEKQKLLFLKISKNVNFKILYRSDFWVLLNVVFWDQQKNMSSIESIAVRYRSYRIRLGIDTIELVSTLLPSLLIIKFLTKNSAGAYVYLSQEWS